MLCGSSPKGQQAVLWLDHETAVEGALAHAGDGGDRIGPRAGRSLARDAAFRQATRQVKAAGDPQTKGGRDARQGPGRLIQKALQPLHHGFEQVPAAAIRIAEGRAVSQGP